MEKNMNHKTRDHEDNLYYAQYIYIPSEIDSLKLHIQNHNNQNK